MWCLYLPAIIFISLSGQKLISAILGTKLNPLTYLSLWLLPGKLQFNIDSLPPVFF